MKISHLDHLVLLVSDLEHSCHFYAEVLGMEIITFGEGRKAARFGNQKINFHKIGEFSSNVAARPTAGSGDLCFISENPIVDWIGHLKKYQIEVELGPILRTGAKGPINSIYFRDPDGNLIEVSNLEKQVSI